MSTLLERDRIVLINESKLCYVSHLCSGLCTWWPLQLKQWYLEFSIIVIRPVTAGCSLEKSSEATWLLPCSKSMWRRISIKCWSEYLPGIYSISDLWMKIFIPGAVTLVAWFVVCELHVFVTLVVYGNSHVFSFFFCVISIVNMINDMLWMSVVGHRYFSYEHFYVIYCKFWELDSDHDFLIDKDDLLRYGNHALTYRIVERIFSQVWSFCLCPVTFESKIRQQRPWHWM